MRSHSVAAAGGINAALNPDDSWESHAFDTVSAVSLGQNEACGRMYASGATIWASAECAPVVWRLNAHTGNVQTIDLGTVPGPGIVGDALPAAGSIWITTDAGELLRLEPESGRLAARYRLPSHLGAGSLTYAGGSLWESDFGDLDHVGALSRQRTLELSPGTRFAIWLRASEPLSDAHN